MSHNDAREVQIIWGTEDLYHSFVYGKPQDSNLRPVFHCIHQSFIFDRLSTGLQKHDYPEAKPALLRSACR